MKKLVMYTGTDEILVCTIKDEIRLVNEFFNCGNRDIEEYDRAEFNYCAVIQSIIRYNAYDC